VLSFLQLSTDGGHQAQKNLIDASIAAGVKRFAPSEWGRYLISFLILKLGYFVPSASANLPPTKA